MFNGSALKTLYDSHGARETCMILTEALIEGKIKAKDFSLKELAVVFAGDDWYESLNPARQGGLMLMENEAVGSRAFVNLTSAIMYSEIMAGYEEDSAPVAAMVPTEGTRWSGELIPGITPILGDVGDHVVHEGMPFPEYGFGEDWRKTPDTEKRGGIVSVTKELVYFDRLGQMLRVARSVGTELAYNRRSRIYDVIIGRVNNYNRQGTTYNTYIASGGNWVNQLWSNELVDYTDVEAAEALFNNRVDPYKGRPIVTDPGDIIVMPTKRIVASTIFGPGTITRVTGDNTETLANPYANGYRVIIDRWLYAHETRYRPTGAALRWYMGDVGKAFKYRQNWAIELMQQGENSDASFERDIIQRFRASERGAAHVDDPTAIARIDGVAAF